MLDSIETEEVAIAAEHAGVPVEPNSPASQVSPPGLDMQQILAELAKVQTELRMSRHENARLMAAISAGNQPEQLPEPQEEF